MTLLRRLPLLQLLLEGGELRRLLCLLLLPDCLLLLPELRQLRRQV
eukprot:SAG22_NODE_19246_length_276_cov_1.920904_1_plen_45_part_01